MGKNSKPSDKDRRAKVEEMRRLQLTAERRKTTLFLGVSAAAGLAVIAAAAVPIYLKSEDDPGKKPLDSFGVAAAAATCDPPTNDPQTGSQEHVGPNTGEPNTTTVHYSTVPPSSGKHYAVWTPPTEKFYSRADKPKIEQLVHNLEHGYTIVWYDQSVSDSELGVLKDLSKRFGDKSDTSKFKVAPWDPAHGAFPVGKHVAMSHWGATAGHRQLCGKVSGQAIGDFVTKYPQTDAPEPNAD